MLFVFGFVIAVIGIIQNDYQKKLAQKALRNTQEDLRKANDEIKVVRDMAIRDEYRAPSSELRHSLVIDLRAVRNQYEHMSLQIYVMPRGASQIRQRIARDLAAILSEAMFTATVPRDSSFDYIGTPPDVMIMTAPAHHQLADALVPILGRFINTQFSVSFDEGNQGRLWIWINGDPLFMPNGVVTFR
jgi:hypothetical protein